MQPCHWRCFHCNATFGNNAAGRAGAKLHFGGVDDTPVCKIESWHYPIAVYVRELNDQLASYRAEDSGVLRAMDMMTAQHAQDLRRVEEVGYGKAVADLKKQLVPAAVSEEQWDVFVNGRAAEDKSSDADMQVNSAASAPMVHGWRCI